jgi:hypothetical protein
MVCDVVFYLLNKFCDEYVPNISLGSASFRVIVLNLISGEEDKYRTVMMNAIYF